MVYVVSQIAVSVTALDDELVKGLAEADRKVKRWASRRFDAPALRLDAGPAEAALKGVTSVAAQQAKQMSDTATRAMRSQMAQAVGMARQASALRLVDFRETQAAEREKVRTKGAADRESLRTRISSLRAETAEARVQGQAQVKIARETAQQRESVYRTMARAGIAAGDAGQALFYGASVPLFALGKAAFDANLRMDSLRRGLVAVSGSSVAAERQLVRLKETAKLPGLGFEEAVRGSIQLQAAGLSAEQASNALSAFGNALATVGKGKDSLNLVNLALSQIATSSKLSGQDVRQLVEQLPQLRTMMTKAFGTADPQMLEKIGVDPKVFIDKLTKEFAKLPRVTGGIQNEVENAQDSINQSLAKIGQSISRVGAGPLARFTDQIGDATTAFSHLSDGAQDAMIKAALGVALGGPVIVGLSRMLRLVTEIRGVYQTMPAAAAKAATAEVAAAESAAAESAAAAQVAVATGLRAKLLRLGLGGLGGAAGTLGPMAGIFGGLGLVGNTLGNQQAGWVNDAKAQFYKNTAGPAIVGRGDTSAGAQINRNRAQAAMNNDEARRIQGSAQYDYVTDQVAKAKAALARVQSGGTAPFKAGGASDSGALLAYGSAVKEAQANLASVKALKAQMDGQITALRSDAGKLMADAKKMQGVGPAMVRSMAAGIETPEAKASCALFASKLMTKLGEAVPTIASAKGLADFVKSHGGQQVPVSEAQSGDLIVYHGPNFGARQKGGARSGYHVGVSTGNGMTAQSSDGVTSYPSVADVLRRHGGTATAYHIDPKAASATDAAQDDYARATLSRFDFDRRQARQEAAQRIKDGGDRATIEKALNAQLAAIGREQAKDQDTLHKQVETAAEKHHKQMLAAATKYLRGEYQVRLDWYNKSAAIGKQVDAANAIDAKNRDFAEAGTPAQFARESANARAGYRSQIQNPYVDQKAAQAALNRTLAEIEQRRKDAADGARARAQAAGENTPQGRAAKTLASFGEEMQDRFNSAQAGLLGDDVESSWQKALATSKDLRAAIELGGKAAQDAHAQFVKAFGAEAEQKAAAKAADLQQRATDALADSRVAYERASGHVSAYDEVIARLNLDVGKLTDAQIAARYPMVAQIAAVDAATAKMRQYHEMMQQVQGALQNSLASTFEKILSGSHVTFKSIADDFKGMVIRMIAEAEAAKVAAFITGKNGLGGLLSGVLGGKPADPTAPTPGDQAAAKGPGIAGLVGAGLSIYSATRGGTPVGAGTPPFAPTPAAGGKTDWLGTAAAIAPAFGPQGAAVGAGLSVLSGLFGKKSAPTASGVPGMPGGMGQGVVPVYVVGMAAMAGGPGGKPGGPGALGMLGGAAGIAASFLPGGSVIGKVLGGIGHLFHFASGTPSVPGMGGADTVPAMLTPGEMVLSRGMLSGSTPAPVLPTHLLLRQLPNAGHAPLVSAFTEAMERSQAQRPITVNATQTIGTVNHEADENRIMEGFGRRLEQTMATY